MSFFKNNSHRKVFNASLATTLVAGAVVTGMPLSIGADSTVPFSDLEKSQDYYKDVLNLTDRGIIRGFPDGTYKPYRSITRGQAAKILAKVLELDTVNVKNPGFSDVKVTDEYYGPIAALAGAGIIIGFPDKTFKQRNTLTRSQMAKIIALGFELEIEELTDTRFRDVKPTAEYAGYVQALLKNGITKGRTPTTFGPFDPVMRGQMASFMVRSEKAVHFESEVVSYTDSTIELTSGTYALPDSLKSLFTESNKNALKNAVITYTLGNNKIIKVKSLELNASGAAEHQLVFDGQNATFTGNLFVNGDYVTVKNLTVRGNLELGSEVKNNFFGENLTVNGETLISNRASTQIDAVASLGQTSVAAVNQTINGPTVQFTNSKLRQIAVSKYSGAEVNLLGNSSVTGFELSANTVITADDGVEIPTVVINEGATHVTIDADIGNLTVNSTGTLTVDGTGDIKNATVQSDANVTFEIDGKINTLAILSADAKINLGTETSIGNITLPKDVDIEDIVLNYDEVKDNIDQIDGEDNTDATPSPPVTPPVTPPGNGDDETPGVAEVTDSATLLAALNNTAVTTVKLMSDITVEESIVPSQGVTIDGNGNTLHIANGDETNRGQNSAEGLYIQNDNVTIKNLTVTGTHGDNLIEVYGNNASFINVSAVDGMKTGFYINHDGEGKMEVSFQDVHTSGNGWKAGIGLVAQKENAELEVTFSGTNTFEEYVGVYSDNTEGHEDYHGTVSVIGLGDSFENPLYGKDNWGSDTSAAASAKFLVDLESGGTITLTNNVVVSQAVEPQTGATIDGNDYTLNIANGDETNTGASSAEGLFISNDNVTINNLKVTGTHGDNLIEIYGNNAKLSNVTATDGKKAGIYVNNYSKGSMTVNFNNINTSGNGWNAGIGLVAQQLDDSITANFTGTHEFGEDVAVYEDALYVSGENQYEGTITVNLDGYTSAINDRGQVYWMTFDKLAENVSMQEGENGDINLSSPLTIEGLTTEISLFNGSEPITFGSLFESFVLTTTVGNEEPDVNDLYEAIKDLEKFTNSPEDGYTLTSGVEQSTTTEAPIKDDVTEGDYKMVVQVMKEGYLLEEIVIPITSVVTN